MNNLELIRQRLAQIRAHDTDFTQEESSVIAGFVQTHWPDSTIEEARTLIDIMESVPSTVWFGVMYQAEHHNIAHWQLLLEHSNRLYGRAADAAADEDGLTTPVPDDIQTPRQDND